MTIRRPELLIAAALGLLLLLVAGRYGYHRDELYFIEAGYHLAWGYPDQPPLVPAIARLASEIAPDSLVVLRVPSLLIAMAVVVLAGVMARRLGAGTGGQALAAASTALCGFVLGMGHLLSTATLDLLGWTLLTYLFLRLLQGNDHRLWLVAGLVAGLTMQANVLVAFLLAGFAVAVLIVGPRRLLASPWLWIGAGIAALFAVPYLLWQGDHGWPQLDIASNISSGGSGSSASRPAFLPLLILQAGPWLLPVAVRPGPAVAGRGAALPDGDVRGPDRRVPDHRRQAVLPRRAVSAAVRRGRAAPARPGPPSLDRSRAADPVHTGDPVRPASAPGPRREPDRGRQLRHR